MNALGIRPDTLLPVFDRYTLPGSTYTFTEHEGQLLHSVSHLRERGAPRRKLWAPGADPAEFDRAQQIMADRAEVETFMRLLEREGKRTQVPAGMMADSASAEAMRSNWITDGPSIAGTTIAVGATSFSAAGSGTGAGPDAQSGFWAPGRAIRWVIKGRQTSSTTPGNGTYEQRLNTTGGNTLGATAAIALAASQTNTSFWYEGHVVCRGVDTSAGGATGSLLHIGQITLGPMASTDKTYMLPATGSSVTAAIDTTANNTIVFCATLGAATVTLVVEQYMALVMN